MPKKVILKTKQNSASVSSFLNAVEDPIRRKECKTVLAMMKEITGKKPKMWGTSIVGFDTYEYKRSNGDVGTFFRAGFSPRKTALTIYIMPGYQDYSIMLKTLGPHKLGKSCLYLKSLEDIHLPTLKKLIKTGYKDMEKLYPRKK